MTNAASSSGVPLSTYPPAVKSVRDELASAGAVLVFAALAVYYGSSFNVVVLLFAWTCFLLPWVAIVPGRIQQVWQANRALCIAAILSLLLIIASYTGSISKESSFSSALGLALCPLAFLFGACLCPGYRDRLLQWLRALVLFFAVISVWQLVTSGVRAYQPLSEPNAYAALLYLAALPWMHRWLSSARQIEGWQDWLQLAAFGCLSMAAFATISRVGTFVFFAALAFWFLSGWLSSRRGVLVVWRRHLALLVVVGSAFLGSVALLGGGLATELADGPVDDSIGVRGFLVNSGVQAIDGSLTGTGIYTFPLLYSSVRTDADISSAGLYIHNDYLQFLLEGGPGLALLLVAFLVWVLSRFAGASLRLLRTGHWEPETGVLMALGCALAHAVVNFIFYVPILALLIGLLASVLISPSRRVGLSPQTSRFSVLAGIGSAVAGVGLALYLALETVNAGILGGQAHVPFVASCAQDDECRLRFADHSSRLNPEWGSAHLARAVLLERLRFDPSDRYAATNNLVISQSLAGYRRALQTDPWSPQTYLQYRAFLVRHPELNEQLRSDENPVALLQRALALDPYNVFAVGQVITSLESIGRRADAQAFLLNHLESRIANFGQRYPEDAEYFLSWLESTASLQPDILQKVSDLRARIVVSPYEFNQRWWLR